MEDFRIADRAGFADDEPGHAAVDWAFRDPGSLLHPVVAGFVAYVDGVPVAAALSFTALDVARVGWVGTVPAFRRRGGRRRDPAACWPASSRGEPCRPRVIPCGRALYRSMGFRTITNYRVWSIG